MVERNRNSGHPDLVDSRCDNAEDQPRGRLRDEMPDRHADRDAGILPRIGAPPAADQQPFEECRDEENWKENRQYRVCGPAQQFLEAEIKFHRWTPCPLRNGRVREVMGGSGFRLLRLGPRCMSQGPGMPSIAEMLMVGWVSGQCTEA